MDEFTYYTIINDNSVILKTNDEIISFDVVSKQGTLFKYNINNLDSLFVEHPEIKEENLIKFLYLILEIRYVALLTEFDNLHKIFSNDEIQSITKSHESFKNDLQKVFKKEPVLQLIK